MQKENKGNTYILLLLLLLWTDNVLFKYIHKNILAKKYMDTKQPQKTKHKNAHPGRMLVKYLLSENNHILFFISNKHIFLYNHHFMNNLHFIKWINVLSTFQAAFISIARGG